MLVHANLLFLSLELFAPLPTQDFDFGIEQALLNANDSIARIHNRT